jgi:septum formation inhibitor MinC
MSTDTGNNQQESSTALRSGDSGLTASASPAPESSNEFAASESKVVTARGTEDGLILRIDGKADWQEILQDIDQFLGGRKKFFEGGQVSLEWLDRLPTLEQSKELEQLLQSNYGIEVVVRRRRSPRMALADGPSDAISNSVTDSRATTREHEMEYRPSGPHGHNDGNTNTSSRNREDVQSLETDNKDSAGSYMSGKKQTRKSGVTINLFQEVSESLAGANPPLPGSAHNSLSSNSLSSESRGLASSISKDRTDSKRGDWRAGAYDFSGSSREDGEDSDSLLSSADSGSKRFASRMARMLGDDLFYEDDANAKVVFGTLRSGQRLETPFSLIVIGDVNPGADLVAGGDIIVFGGLRGTAHASAYDDEAYDRVIIALQMQPMQLRIGSVISRGSDELVRGAEIARIENRRIIVEAFNPRALLGKKFR